MLKGLSSQLLSQTPIQHAPLRTPMPRTVHVKTALAHSPFQEPWTPADSFLRMAARQPLGRMAQHVRRDVLAPTADGGAVLVRAWVLRAQKLDAQRPCLPVLRDVSCYATRHGEKAMGLTQSTL